ncbi:MULTISPECIES: efflux RND transporter permease subunit [unclassified Undibacterium]|uniref:efflux RND transporter permease subunit n=1 Tax=unclassified Undibacterium TaxID=2630295 RepID=UPI002AC9C623|nr:MULTISPECIES: efflux RND transporter permease subunit [unclassified Undibacterium]MEB0139075.1 efflux RND transporter permease subunit [Undibacterium sp. CCC2.1]MEB0172968.1 efflux RND transporter permease subunit [Undibacterium sp. CCC1.1]MEB0177290.1 efflux RND transporter permease subunit [Undibacterium sp. CCC3.4]MEB0215886.1 efflux RND transporter permease subunit [Undibacterium sp. 5I2]WPX42088.1 efflux RND transporter permease subunit [Undibacterium sp. CCC3.4]
MWIVQIALRRPYTFIVMALLILLSTPLVLTKMATDIFPDINIPVISIIWNYGGLSAQEMGQRVTATSERSLTTTVNDIEHIESQSLAGIAIIKIFFQPEVNIQTAIAQVVAIEQAQLRQLPAGMTPPLIIKYSASSIPVVQLGLSSPTMTEQALGDTAINFLRPQLITVPGAAIPYPYGGKMRVVSVDLDNQALLAKGLTPTDVVNAVNAQNLALPSGTAKIGATEFNVSMNGSPDTIAGLNQIPVSAKNGSTTYLSEVAHVRDGFSPQTNIVRQDGQRGALLSVLKNGASSTLKIVSNIKSILPEVALGLPKDLKISTLFDQSVFVKAAISGVIHEALIAACLTALMILLFLGNWRSTLIIAISIPLSILSSILALYALGETINIMTLGGLALAVGILVDDATVTIENIERHLHLGVPLETAILDGAGEIAVPALVSTLCICIVFVPMFFLTGVARFLFVPLAEAVVFAMLASYILSRTLVPTLVLMMMGQAHSDAAAAPSLLQRVYRRFDAGFEQFRGGYIIILASLLTHRKVFAGVFLAFCIASCALVATLGRDFFPSVDSGQIRLHMRAPTGTRIEETARIADEVEKVIRSIIPAAELDTILDNLGLPYSGINLSYGTGGTIGAMDGEILMSLKPEHGPASQYVQRLRQELPRRFPGVEFYFQPADIVTQILNFGLPAAIDIQIAGADVKGNYQIASRLMKQVSRIPGTVDVHIHQKNDLPTLALETDRIQIKQLGLNPVDIAQNLLVSLSGSFQTAPAFWFNPVNGVVYSVAIQTPQYRNGDLDSLLRTPIKSAAQVAGQAAASDGSMSTQLLGNLVQVRPASQLAVVSRYNIKPVIDLYVSVEGRDLAGVAGELEQLVEAARKELPRGASITVRGQVETMRSSFLGLGLGLVMAIILVYLLIVVNFQSWIDPLIIISALPAALAGIVWMLFLSHTPLSVPALTGAIMTMGVATANSILMVSFARQCMDQGAPPLSAALEAGATRIRPVLMTALAMIIGMVPMAIGFGEGAEQNAPLGRAVIGGLLFATISTLFFVPVVFAGIHKYLAGRRSRSAPASSLPAVQ